ncbi:MAG TPA: hypothetical protein VI485_23415 [Vicinamibacterales bacterium]|nr:hypothetical protein [Vicinamibacterales bacterium]
MSPDIAITGTVLERREHRPINDVTVEALISVGEKTRPFKTTTTDKTGSFRFETNQKEWDRLVKQDEAAFVFFRVSFGEPTRVVDTRESRQWRPEGLPGLLHIYVDLVAPRRLTGTVVDAEERPVPGVVVLARIPEVNQGALVLGSATTDKAGRYAIEYPGEGFGSPATSVDLEVVVYSDATLRRVLTQSAVEDVGGGERTHDVRLPAPEDSLAILNTALNKPLPESLIERLAGLDLRTLSALRAAGGAPRRVAAASGELKPELSRLNAIVSLSITGAPVPVLARLAESGVKSIMDLAQLPDEELSARFGSDVSPEIRGRYRARASHFVIEIGNRIAQKRYDLNTPGAISDEFDELFRVTCHCECASVTSAQAYLAQLLRFSLQVVRYNGAPIDIGFLQDWFKQPLRDLPATCDSAERKVAQPRIAIEVLRKDLAALGRTAQADDSPQWYREAAYLDLVQFVDLRYEEMREVSLRTADTKAKFIQAKGLGIDDPSDALIFDELFRDISAPLTSPATAVTEPYLQRVFGLRSTLADPLDPDMVNPRALVFRREALRVRWVRLDASTSRPLAGVPLVDPHLVDEFDLVDRTVAPPNDQIRQWRPIDFLQRRRREMEIAEAVIAAELTPDPATPPAQQFKDLFLELAALQSFIPPSAIPVPPYGFTDGADVLDDPRMRQMRNALDAGQDISADLARFRISAADVRAIVRHLEALELNVPVTADESFDVRRIILAHVKRAGFWPTWLAQEIANAGDPAGQLALEPGKFRLRTRDSAQPDPVWQPRPRLADSSERVAWEDVLRFRTRTIDAMVTELAARIVALESRLLPELRNALIRYTGPGGVYTKAKVDALIDRYQLDFVAGGCRRTTRVSQAIETVQGLLFGARNGLFNTPGWSIVAADFDAIWRWLGSFDTWYPAMLAFLNPIDLLRPSLRGDVSPGSADALQRMRDADPIGLPDAVTAYSVFADYLNDAASLELLAAAARPIAFLPGAGQRSAVYLIGGTVGRGARRFYWSVAIEQPDGAGDQSWWRPIPAMDRVDDVVGGALCGVYAIALTVSTVATSRVLELWRLALPGTDLTDADLLRDAPTWEGPFSLELPEGVNTFLSAAMSAGSSAAGPLVTIEADETRIYTRSIDLGAKSWTGRFRSSPAQSLWRRLGQSDPYGITPANSATFACNNNGLLQTVPDERFVLAADVDGDGADELIAFGGADGFWSMKQIMVGPRATWLPLGINRPATSLYDVTLAPASQRLFFAVSGDFDGDGVSEVAAIIEARKQGGSIYTSWLNLFAKKWNTAAAAWESLGVVGDPPSGAQLWYSTPWFDPRACVVGRFTQSERDEILIAYRDQRYSLELTEIEVLGLVGGTWTSQWSRISDFAGQGQSGGAIGAGRTVEDGADQLLMQQLSGGGGGLANGRFWTVQYQNGQWRRMADLDAGALSGVPKLIVEDFDGDGVAEVACADDTPSIRFFKHEMNGWSLVQTVTTPSPVDEWTAGDFGNNGASYVIAQCTNDARAGVPVHIDQNAILVAEQQPDLTLGSLRPARGVISGRFAGRQQPSALAALGDGCTVYVQAKSARTVTVSRPGILKFKPYLTEPYRLHRAGTAFRLVDPSDVAVASLRAFQDNRTNRSHNQAYLEEAYYFLIVEITLRLQSASNFAVALDWFQLIARLAGNKRIPQSAFLALDTAGALAEMAPLDLDPIDTHAVARRRAGTYNRYSDITAVRLLTDYADSEFAFATSESLARARELYITALALLDQQPSVFGPDGCARAIETLVAEVKAIPALAHLIVDLQALSEIDDVVRLNAVIGTIRGILAGGGTADEKAEAIRAAIQAALEDADDESTFADRIEIEETTAQIAHLSVMPGLNEILFERLDRIDLEELLGNRRPPPRLVLPQFSFCIPPLSQHLELRRRIELALDRLSNCRDIGGNELIVTPVGARALSPANQGAARRGLQPLPYRYQTLIERAKQLLEIARQLEATMLNYIETAERKRYEAVSARRDLALANAAERLKAVQAEQAVQELGAAALQRDRAQDQVDKWSQLLRDGLNEWEVAGVAAQWASFGLKQSAAIATTIKYAATPEGWVKDIITFGAEASAEIARAQADAADAFAQAASTMADFERRNETWALNMRDARRDVQIGNQQITVAATRVQGALVEQQIASLQASFASQIVTLLTTTNFGNEALYEWMAGVLEGTYRFFLQQASQLARMAELQLGFERQEAPQGLIKRDYWSRMRSDSSPNVNSVSSSTDSLRGLTGAANLLRDLYQLDQLAFVKNQRKHQLTETISLVRHDPLAFAQMAVTGRIAFETPMEMFDAKLPGHYLRLIRRVRISVIALIPPSVGVRAVLSNSGVSRVVIPSSDTFETVTLQRGYEDLVFTTSMNATGVFELDAQPELRNTFEGSGLDTRWVMDLPRPANPINFESLADILVTFEYTSLSNSTLRAKVIAALPGRQDGARVFSLRHEFPDLWFDLCNPNPPGVAVESKIQVRRSDFPPNLDDIRVTHLALSVRFRAAATPLDIDYLRFAPSNAAILLDGGPARLDGSGVVSTRRANGGGWVAIVSGAAMTEPIGEWRLRFSAAALPRFKSQDIDDVLFTLAFDGRTPPWP